VTEVTHVNVFFEVFNTIIHLFTRDLVCYSRSKIFIWIYD